MHIDGSNIRTQNGFTRAARAFDFSFARVFKKPFFDVRFFMKKEIIRQAAARIPTPLGAFDLIAFADSASERMPHLAFVSPDFATNFDQKKPVLVRIHSECLTGDVFASRRCDCGEQLWAALKMIADAGGALIYLRQEGRGIGLINKLKAYNLQDAGLDTMAANLHLGFEADARQYGAAISILQDLGIEKVRLITNNPLKIQALQKSKSVEIAERVALAIEANADNFLYLKAKKELMGHLF